MSEREKFEAWLPLYWPRSWVEDEEGDWRYSDTWVQGAWIGWQAARMEEMMVVSSP